MKKQVLALVVGVILLCTIIPTVNAGIFEDKRQVVQTIRENIQSRINPLIDDTAPPVVIITKPIRGAMYDNDRLIGKFQGQWLPEDSTLIFRGGITVRAFAFDFGSGIDRVEFECVISEFGGGISDVRTGVDTTAPYSFFCEDYPFDCYNTITVTAYDSCGNSASNTIQTLKIDPADVPDEID